MDSAQLLLAGLALSITFFAARLLQRKQRLPPGPPGDPVIGHARKIPQTESWKTFAEWGRLYGSVVSVQALGRSMIIVNTFAAARDLLEKKGANFSDRPSWPTVHMVGWGVILPILPYGAYHRKQRRMIQQYLGPSAVQSSSGIQEDRVTKFLKRLLETQNDLFDEIHGHIASIVLSIVYAHDVGINPASDPLIRLNDQAIHVTATVGGIGTVFDFFPILRHLPAWLPGMGLKRRALEARKVVDAGISVPYEEVKTRKIAGDATPCVLYQLLDEYEGLNKIGPEDELSMMNFAASFYNAGIETTQTSLQVFFLMMVLNPDVQKRAQEIIDQTVGLDRLPSIRDRANLPYIECILKEVFRIHPPTPLGVPHQSMETDEYQGWTIPGRSMIIPNIWQMMRDENNFPDPDKFDPERHTAAVRKPTVTSVDGEPKAGDNDLVYAVFGFGRRYCPGRALAESTLWLTIANVLAAFEILPYKDPTTGEDIFPAVEFEHEVVNFVKPFRCTIVPRKGRVSQIVQDA